MGVGQTQRDIGPGIGSLVDLIRTHGEAVEADLRRYYHTRLADLTTGRLTWRELRVLIARLPVESETRTEIDPNAGWSPVEHLLAGIFDVLRVLSWQMGGKGKPPKPLERPGVERPGIHHGGKPLSLDEVRALLPGVEGANGESG
jgi:hypothetical protein